MAVGFGLCALRARVSGGAVENRAYRWGIRSAFFASARSGVAVGNCAYRRRILRALRARVPDAWLETAPTGGVSGLRALRARVLHGSHGI